MMRLFKEDTCENCHKRGKRKFKIRDPKMKYRKNEMTDPFEDIWIFCSVMCAKEFGAWMLAGTKNKLPKGWKVEEIINTKRKK